MRIPVNPDKVIPSLCWLYRAWCKSLRFSVHGSLPGEGEPCIFGLWHRDIFSLVWTIARHRKDTVSLISQSEDGEYLARLIGSLGDARFVRGSSSRGGVRALLQAVRIMKNERCPLAFAIDGPKGPAMIPKDGIFMMAHRANVPIIPIRVVANNRFVFQKAWDKTQLPYPFTKVSVYFGDPLYVDTERLSPSYVEYHRIRLMHSMHKLVPCV